MANPIKYDSPKVPANDNNLFDSATDPVARISLNYSGAKEMRRVAIIAAFCAAGAILIILKKPEIIHVMPVYLNTVIVTAVTGTLGAIVGFSISCYMQSQAEYAQQEIMKFTGKRYTPLRPRDFKRRFKETNILLRKLRR